MYLPFAPADETDHLGMLAVSRDRNDLSRAGFPFDDALRIGDEAAGAVDDADVPPFALRIDRLRNAVGTDQKARAVGNCGKVVHDAYPPCADAVVDVLVVDEFPEDIGIVRGNAERRVDGFFNARAKPAVAGDDDLHALLLCAFFACFFAFLAACSSRNCARSAYILCLISSSITA